MTTAATGTAQPTPHRHLALRRVLAGVVAGAVGGCIAMFFLAWQAAILIGWSVGAITFMVWVWAALLPLDAGATRTHATREDDSRLIADLTLLLSSVASLVAVGLLLLKGSQAGGSDQAIFTGVSALAVVVSWGVVHTVFALRYGRLYYSTDGGINFHDRSEPTYQDFAYLAFTVGMTYQVSDTEIPARVIRTTVLRHALLSFLFGTTIIAMTINIVAGLVK
jgi:uncharacterized membrane protein